MEKFETREIWAIFASEPEGHHIAMSRTDSPNGLDCILIKYSMPSTRKVQDRINLSQSRNEITKSLKVFSFFPCEISILARRAVADMICSLKMNKINRDRV